MVAFSVSTATAGPASGARSCDDPSLRGLVVAVVPGAPHAPIEVPVHPAVMTKVHLAQKLASVTRSKLDGIAWGLTPHGILIEATGAPIGKAAPSRGVITATTADGPIVLALRAVDEPEQAFATVIVERRDAHARGDPVVMVLGRQCAQTAVDEQRRREGVFAFTGGSDAYAFFERNGAVSAIELLDDFERVPIPDPDPTEQGVIVRGIKWFLTAPETMRILRFFIANRSDRRYRLARVQLLNALGTDDYARWIQVEHPRNEDGTWTLDPGERVQGLLWVFKPELLGEFATLMINEPEGERPRMQNKIPVIDLRPPCGRPGFPEPCPLTPEEEERRRRDREAKRVSLHLVASYGAIWLPSGADGPEELEPASLKGLGVRVTKGFFPNLAFEAEIAGGTSGIVDYGTVTVGGTEGDLTRSAKLGRFQVGGMIRFGDKIVPYARAGIGLQVVSHDSALMTAGGEMSGPGSGMGVDGSVYGGAGVDVTVGSNLIAGLGFSYTAAQSNQRILDFGLNLAYRWDPPKIGGGNF